MIRIHAGFRAGFEHLDGKRREPWGMDPVNLDSRQIHAHLRACGQDHLLRFYAELSDAERASLLLQLQDIDFEHIRSLTESSAGPDVCDANALNVEPMPVLGNHRAQRHVLDAGRQALTRGQVGVLIVAGGEGSRLGFDGPKGCFPLGPIEDTSLYQWLLERVVASSRQFGVDVPVYLMTSPSTHSATQEFLNAADWFGIPPSCRHIFCQGTMPVVDDQGRVLLESKSRVCVSPDGHGGVIPALLRQGLLESMRERGIEHLFYCQVDNPVAPLLDAGVIGEHVLNGSQVTVLSVEKTEAAERAGTVVSIDGRMHVIEYSLIPASIAACTDDTGRLKYRAANTGIHLFRADFLMQQAQELASLPFHSARKCVRHIDDQGSVIEPAEPNAVKFERFVFDVFPRAESTLVIEVDRTRHFLPLKDARSTETGPEAVRNCLSRLHRDWLQHCEIDVPQDAMVEISPLLATSAEQLADRIAAGDWQWQPEQSSVYLSRAA